ncbi:unnamed protein product [Camellia sinensis]
MVHLYQRMDLMSGYKNCVQGVVGLVFGNENSASSEDSYVERLLDRISNGVLAEDRRTTIAELQFVVAESRAAQLAFGAIAFGACSSCKIQFIKFFEMVRGALETLVSALTPIDQAKALKNEAQPTLMNTDLLSREVESISLLLSLLFLLRLQETILTIPRGITWLMDMLMDREEGKSPIFWLFALLLLTYLTREAEEIQKILVFEGAFEKIFSIINEEGCSEGGVVVQDCPEIDTGKDTNRLTNKAVLVQALRCIGDLIANHPKNLDALASKVLGEEPQVEPALYSILRIILRISNMQEFVATDYVFKCFCEKNLDGQAMLASTLIPQPQPTTHAPLEEDVNMSFGRPVCPPLCSHMLLHGLTLSQNDGDLKGECSEVQTCSRAASVLSHVLKDNIQCKERVLRIELEEPTPSLGAPEPLLHHIVKYLALASCMKSKEGKSNASGNRYVQAIILKLLPWKPLTRSTAASMAESEDVEENEASDLKNGDHPMLASMFDAQFVDFIRNLEAGIRESVVDVYSHPKSKVAVVLVELQHKNGKSDVDYIKRLKSFVEKQYSEITDLLSRNVTLAEDLAKIGRGGSSQPEHRSSGGSKRVPLGTLHRDLQEASQQLDTLKTEKTKIESEASMYCNLAGKMESNLKSLSDAYNSLEQANFHLEKEIKALKSGGATPIPDVEAVKAKAREEAQKESEAELNGLLVCLVQEQSKVEKLSVRLLELGEDVDKLLEGIGDDIGLLEDVEVEED